jgi:tape measure domain-containing protein
MPTVDPVILQLRADVAQYRNEIRSTTTLVSSQLDRQERSILSLEHQAERSAGGITRSFASINQSALAFAGGFALGSVIRQMIALADQSKQLESQLRLATDGFGSFGQAQTDVQRIAELTRGSLEATAKLYGGFIRASRETGRTQEDAARATQTFAEALKIGGAGAEEAASATLQFNQALQSGVLRGDEFNSILEASPRIARLLADGLGVPIGQLRAMAEQGRITSDVLFRALTDRKFTAGIDAEFRQVPVTFSDAMQLVENAALTTFGAFDKGGRFSEVLASFVGNGADGFKSLADSAEAEGANIRAAFEGLRDAFSPLLSGGQEAFAGIRSDANYTRDTIASLLSGIDQLRNFLPNLQNQATAFDNRIKAGLNRAMNRAGRRPGDAQFQMGAITPLSNMSGDFLLSNRRSIAKARMDAQARRLEGLGYTVPRNADGTVNEAGIVRRAPVPRRPVARPSAPARSSGRSGGGGGARARSRTAAGDDLPTVAELTDAIAKDLRSIAADGGIAMRSDAEELDRAARNFQGVFGREGKDYDDPFAGVADYDKERDVQRSTMEDAEREAQYTREANVRSLADLYGDLFARGTDDVWRNFKEQGLRTLALILAQATISSFTGGGGGFGSLIGNIGKAAGSVFGQGGSGIPRFASGGSMLVGGRAGVDQNLLSLNGQPIAAVSRGETLSVNPNTRAAGGRGGGTTVLQTIAVDARGAVMNDQFASQILARADQGARQIVGANNVAARKSLPSAQARFNALGTT